MEQATLNNPPVTMGELSELLNRQLEDVLIAKLIKDAMQRRLSATEQGKSEEGYTFTR